MSSRFADTPKPPYYAVMFTNQISQTNDGYEAMANKMFDMAMEHAGCLGVESTRDASGVGITISYWKDEAAIAAWKADAKHLVAQKMGMDVWYDKYSLRVALVERAYEGPEGREL
jgi:heme-degrading monooxygenase HmoA